MCKNVRAAAPSPDPLKPHCCTAMAKRKSNAKRPDNPSHCASG